MPTYKNTKNGTWYCKFNYKNWQGQMKQKKKEGFSTQKEAKAFEKDFLNTTEAKPDMPFSSLYSRYIEYSEKRLRPTTMATKIHLLEKKILPYFKDLRINEITPATVSEWQNELLDQGYAPTYLKTIHNQLSAIFNYGAKYFNMQTNPARQCGSMGKKNAESMEFYTLEEFEKFISAFEEDSVIRLLFEILFWTGIRSGELLALTQMNFDLEEGKLFITKNYARLEKEDYIQPPKTPMSRRTILLPNFLTKQVQFYVSKQYDLHPTDRLFPFTKHLLYHGMVRGAKISGIKKIRVHDLRHSHASLLIENGFTPLLIAERLGHENVETTLQTYSHLYPNKQNEIATKLDALNKSRPSK